MRNEAFIELIDGAVFDVKPKYKELGMKTAIGSCFVRATVFEMLEKVQESLPVGYSLRIWDTWRPLALQKELYETYKKSIIETFNLENLSEDERNTFISRYIAIPSEDRNAPPAHTTGGAVDLTLIDENGNEVDMGTEFDDFSEKAATDYFEGEEDSVIRRNRKILFDAMTGAGFTNLQSEWWHYDFGDANWASQTKNEVLYSGVFALEEMTKII